jgi:acetolactate synthase-1/3 small subunit
VKRTITALVTNRSGVLNRVTGLFSRRKFNIESITVRVTDNPGISRVTFDVLVDQSRGIEQVLKQLNKQIDVLEVKDITNEPIFCEQVGHSINTKSM